jgi:ribonucleotide monophosphatase NagD (HAD superfamily)
MLIHYTAVVLDFDGTIFSNGVLDVDYLEYLKEKYSYVIIASNNSSISHRRISEIVKKERTIELITPQLIAKAMTQLLPGRFSVVANPEVRGYINDGEDLKLGMSLWSNKYNEIIRENINLMAGKRCTIIGKCSESEIKNQLQWNNTNILLMNRDKKVDSTGIEYSELMLGDIMKEGKTICKNSKIYQDILLEIIKDLQCKAVAVIGDNRNTDGKLAEALGIIFKLKSM